VLETVSNPVEEPSSDTSLFSSLTETVYGASMTPFEREYLKRMGVATEIVNMLTPEQVNSLLRTKPLPSKRTETETPRKQEP
jgi:hypothetical protein